MIVGVMLLSMVMAIGATASSVMMGYGLLTALGVYVTVGMLGMILSLTLCLLRQREDTDPVLVESRA